MDNETRIENLENALEYALDIIENYEMDIRNWNNGKLLEEGFCQGRIYKGARDRIRELDEHGRIISAELSSTTIPNPHVSSAEIILYSPDGMLISDLVDLFGQPRYLMPKGFPVPENESWPAIWHIHGEKLHSFGFNITMPMFQRGAPLIDLLEEVTEPTSRYETIITLNDRKILAPRVDGLKLTLKVLFTSQEHSHHSRLLENELFLELVPHPHYQGRHSWYCVGYMKTVNADGESTQVVI